jgi:imidazoleglycerol-phosphate dehydratase/histidinol-phosphatase
MKRLLFIDRDGTLIKESPPTYQIDSWDKLEFYPEVFQYMSKIATEFDYELIMVSNQDGLGTPSYPEEKFWPVQNFIVKSFANEDVHFSAFHFDKTFHRIMHQHANLALECSLLI